ncbi:hypothetical protein MXD61_11410 [Frankia sp. AgPm24]|uniref:hypothetical protein n=1 Tax=Frankia sp. AgPm24 TaxID=631128 RepID=UPI00200FF650|nr:hypothetical protein [Frankia sp. AgPm24]MCK9922479.1 hypothetical protein [Frankia sp. AgPm24]
MTQHGTTASRGAGPAPPPPPRRPPPRRQDPGHSRHDARLAWATLLVSSLLLAGCSPSTHSPPAPSTTTRPTTAAVASTPVPSWTFHPTADPINDAYLQFWAAFSDAQARGEPDHPPMIRHANGQALDWAQAVIRGYAARGWVRTIEKG